MRNSKEAHLKLNNLTTRYAPCRGPILANHVSRFTWEDAGNRSREFRTGTAHAERSTSESALSTAAAVFFQPRATRLKTRTPNGQETPWAPPKGLPS
ncbi:hypothetical protein PGT21_036106 [Puccinia graminis f. sp. tritici]|uniref:Uncharacterized protein n=1 Tax=Puccinia graminis f. sp. tritici TaxID=56615 RepID=A0A5B0PNF4_PUCGR|nr:hypothetical protein PGT21_036106 [Puccinia graminis f. sp. tritici]